MGLEEFKTVEVENRTHYWPRVNKDGLKFADFFSGAGGLTTGFVMAGFKPVMSIEIMKQANETYKRNISSKFSNRPHDVADIRSQSVKDSIIAQLIKQRVKIIVGGFPCQGFSMAGKRSPKDSRNFLYKDMFYIASKVKPDVIVMENVPGLRTMQNGNVEKKILSDYKRIGYKISVNVLNAADFNVPQERKRVIFIANRIGETNLYPKPFTAKNDYSTVLQALDGLSPKKEDPTINHIFTKHTSEIRKKISNVKPGKSLYEGYSDAWKRCHLNKPSPTVKENHGGVLIHPTENRVMTPRELARLQSFPDDFIFQGSKKWQLVQIGNAVPPLFAKAIALSVKQMLSSAAAKSN